MSFLFLFYLVYACYSDFRQGPASRCAIRFFPKYFNIPGIHRNSSAGDDICRTALGCLHFLKTRRFDSTKFSETTPFASAAALSEKGRLDSTKISEGCRFREVCALEPLRAQKMQTAKSGSIALTEIWRHSTAFSEIQASKGRFDSTRYSGGCRFRKFGAMELPRFQMRKQRRTAR